MKQINEFTVFISNKESACEECGEDLGRQAWITLCKDKGVLCLACADLDHLIFLPSGNAALTRRARKYSTLSTVVLKWSSSRKRYERQGLLVDERGLEKAETECLADKECRARRKARETIKRAEFDQQYIKRFSQRIREMFPFCPEGREIVIAEHACLKYSGRVGRTAAAKNLNEKVVRLAVIAHIRHMETKYDELLAKGYERLESRFEVETEVNRILADWGRVTLSSNSTEL